MNDKDIVRMWAVITIGVMFICCTWIFMHYQRDITALESGLHQEEQTMRETTTTNWVK